MEIYIPEKFDIETFETELSLKQNIKHYKRDKLAYLLYLINYLNITKHDDPFDDGFVTVNAQLLQSDVKEHKAYFTYLLEYGILEMIGYIPEVHSRKYRFIEPYAVGVKSYVITDWSLSFKLQKRLADRQAQANAYKTLMGWFNKNLLMDVNYCRDFIKQEYDLKSKNRDLIDEGKFGVKKSILDQLNTALMHLDRYEKQNFQQFSLDAKGKRFHSILTNTRSMLRNGLTYGGEQLVSIDISNSQPYLSVLLFSGFFWKKVAKTKKIREITDKVLENNNTKTVPLMLETISESLDKPDVLKYKDLVCSGQFYEFFEEEYKKATGEAHSNRGALKSEMFLVLFSKNSYRGRKDTKGKDLFIHLFPNVYRVFELIKNGDHTLLPLLLQRIESLIILDDICLTISDEHPEIPLFTIHDSIVTTAQHVDYVHEMMMQKLTGWVGRSPQLKVEKWDKGEIEGYLNDLIKRSKAFAS